MPWTSLGILQKAVSLVAVLLHHKVNRDRILGKIADDLMDQFGQRTSK